MKPTHRLANEAQQGLLGPGASDFQNHQKALYRIHKSCRILIKRKSPDKAAQAPGSIPRVLNKAMGSRGA